jgi:hypothetical protein
MGIVTPAYWRHQLQVAHLLEQRVSKVNDTLEDLPAGRARYRMSPDTGTDLYCREEPLWLSRVHKKCADLRSL